MLHQPCAYAVIQLSEQLAVCVNFTGSTAGTYSSPIANVGARFGTMVGGLTTGRMLIGQGAIDACKIGEVSSCQYARLMCKHCIN
jgi:hypothetical protein